MIYVDSRVGSVELRTARAAVHFRSVPAMISASEEEWREVGGIGKVLARRAWQALHKEK